MDLKLWRWPLAQLVRRLAISYLIAWTLSPPLAYGLGWRVAALFAIGAWLLLELRAPRSVLIQPSLPILGAMVFFAYSAAIEWLVPDAADVTYHFQVWIMLFFLVVGESLRRGRDADAKFYAWLILLIMPIWMLTTLRGLDVYGAHVARVVVRSSAEARELAEHGIGGYGFVYGVVLSVPFLVHLVFRSSAKPELGRAIVHWSMRGLAGLNLVLGTLLLIRAGYSIAMLLSFSAALLVLLIRTRRLLPLAISLCASALLALAASMLLQPALDSLQDAVRGTEYAAKVRDIRTSLKEGDSVGTVEGRSERYLRSLGLFVEHPIGGTLMLDPVGKHSAILDRFAQYGVAVGSLFLALLVYVPIATVREQRMPLGLATAFLLVAFLFPLLNTIFTGWGLMLYVFSRGVQAMLGVPLDSRDAGSHGRH